MEVKGGEERRGDVSSSILCGLNSGEMILAEI